MPPRILIYLENGLPPHFSRERAAFLHELESIGSLTLMDQGGCHSPAHRLENFRSYEVIVLFHASLPLPPALARDPGALRIVCGCLGSVRRYVPRELIEAGIPVTNWGSSPDYGIAEGAVCLLLATLKNLHRQIHIIRQDGWRMDREDTGGSLRDLRLGVYGCGAIGLKFLEFVKPFEPRVGVFDPYAQSLPSWVERVGNLRDLFARSQAIAIHAALTPETQHSVTAELLALLPPGGIIVNTARGAIIDQQALFRELESGRLRAGLDVLDPDWLPPGHPAKQWDNCIFTAHAIDRDWPRFGAPRTELNRAEIHCLQHIRNFFDEKPLPFRINPTQYDRMT